MLVIDALVARNSVCANARSPSSRRNFTSGKITSNGKRAFMWGGTPGNSRPLVVTARIYISKMRLVWGAFWMLPQTSNTWYSGCGAYGGWCTSGEIDIFESVGVSQWTWGSIHYGGNATVNHLNCQQKTGEWCEQYAAG